MRQRWKIAVLILIAAAVALLLWQMPDLHDQLTLSSVQQRAQNLRRLVQDYYVQGVIVFMGFYAIVNLWFPAAAVLGLLAGFMFGTLPGIVYVLSGSLMSALMAFWISRNFAGHWIQRRWHRHLERFNRELAKRGSEYILIMRLIPMMPFILINYLAGLTPMRLRTYVWTTALGSLPGIFVLCFSGDRLLTITSVDDVFTPQTIAAMLLLAGFVIVTIVFRIVLKNRREVQNDVSQ